MPPTDLVGLIDALGGASERHGLHFYDELGEEPEFCSYPRLRQWIDAAASRYLACGVSKGARVVLPFETSRDCVVAFFALVRAEALVLCVRPPSALARGESYAEFLARLGAQHQARFVLDTPSLAALKLPLERLPLPTLAEPTAGILPEGRAQPEDIAFVQFSSGSTSTPKGVPITHEKLIAQLGLLRDFDRRKPGDAGANWLPLFHDMGLIGGFLSCLYAEVDLHLCSPRQFLSDPLGWLDLVSRRRVRGFAIPNFGIEYLLRAIRAADEEQYRTLRFDALRHVFVGAEPINPDSFRAFAEVLADLGMQPEALQPAYGMAEAVLIASGGRDTPARIVTAANGRRCISAGKPLPGFELTVIGEGGRRAREREPGEVLLRGGTLATHYFEHETPLLDAGGYYHTGDIGFLDGGELFVLGRSGDRIKLSGETYYAQDFERVVEALPGVRARSCIVLQRDAELFVLVERARSSDSAEFSHHVQRAILNEMGIKLPESHVVPIKAGQIRRTSSGKLQRLSMLDAFTAGKLELLPRAREGSAHAPQITTKLET